MGLLELAQSFDILLHCSFGSGHCFGFRECPATIGVLGDNVNWTAFVKFGGNEKNTQKSSSP